MQIQIKGVRVIDPGNIEGIKDISIKDGLFEAVSEPGQLPQVASESGDVKVIDGQGLIAVPGLIDVHVHLREPGQEYKETIETGLKAAAAGGFTAVCCMPNTKPVNDNAQVTAFILSQAQKANSSRVYPAGAISSNLEGQKLNDIADMKKAGIQAVTDDGMPVTDSQLMRRALEYCKSLDIPILVHAEDKRLADGGAMNEGLPATVMGIKGIPNAAESVMVMRDIALAELTGARVHFCHMSTAQSIEAIRTAKAKGVHVTCETAPHYFTLTDADIPPYDTNFKMNPPLRSETDRQAIIEGLIDGTIDMIATDHAPHAEDEKQVEFDQAAFGIVGLETALALSLDLVTRGHLTLVQLVEKMAKAPAKLLGINNDIVPGNPADLTLINENTNWTVDPDTFVTKGRNTPFAGQNLIGAAVMTIVEGRIVYTRS
ncbi:dihydroorotase [uncultured Desulfobacter sp.]|uniref:dihydroorotase n=1 Tax=uncultured Desulfobacter sp. TaxID=240139 RepID=UPI002AAA9771|nr:dihydroorotase [uncultured Desulfobacter sp.]